MEQHAINGDLDNLMDQLSNLKSEFDKGIRTGKCFVEVKLIHLQIKELSRLIQDLQTKNESRRMHSSFGREGENN